MAATTDSLPRSGSEMPEVPERVGRYLVIQQLGAGGMGVVYKAYDPDLDRKVALKLLRGKATEHTRARLLREAQAMAKLSHPGVVPVFDVGTVGDQVFVAMDFVAGETLQQWLAVPRPWQEVLGVFEQAGLGLAAAHAVGLIHRDFKPENVLLSRDPTGNLRAQVADFGLARRDDDASPDRPDDSDLLLSRGSMLDHGLTRIGAVVGTPLYMSPEQHAGVAVDVRTDQFSFCVALFEGLYRVRPFEGDTVEALALAASLPRRRAPPAGSKVPGWLLRLCLRGLQPDREARFSGMEALLAEVARGRVRARNRWIAAGAAATLAAVLSGMWWLRGEPPPPPCIGGVERMAGVWDDATRARAGQAFLATDKVYAADAWTGAAREVDAYADAWLAMHRDSCEATQVRGEQSAELMDLRAACLADHLRDLAALTALYGRADATVVKQAVAAALALPPLDACADAAALRDKDAAPPADQAEAVAAVRGRLAEARTLMSAGKGKDALAIAAPALTEAEALGYAPLIAEARLTTGGAQSKAGDDEAAATTLRAAVAGKLAVRDDAGLLSALIDLGGTLGYDLGRDKEAAPWVELAEATLDRTGRKPRDVARLLLSRATIDLQAQRFEAAEGRLLRSTALLTELLGPDHQALANHLNSLGAVHLRTGKYAEAQAQFERAVALAERSGGPNHPDVAYPLNNLALAFERQARYDDAIVTLRRALGLIARTSGPDHPNVGLLRQNIGGMLRLAGKLPEARAELDQGLKIMHDKLGPEHPILGHALTLSGDIALDQGDRTRARVDYERSEALRRKILGADHPDRALSLLGLGRLELAEGRLPEATAALEKALALMATTQPDPIDQAEVQFNLARALPPSERTRARTLASEARAGFIKNGARAARYVPEVDAWLAANPGK